ncbi:MAG: hypothetical protein PVSMB7_07000 [Chloroflexota bacterium]
MTALGRLCLLATILAAPWYEPGQARAVTRPGPPIYTVLIVLDGALPSYFDRRALPHIAWLMDHGTTYTRAFAGQELANTPPSHATIGTGVFPRNHGVEGFWWQDPVTHTLTRPTDNRAVLAGTLAAIIDQHHAPSLARAIKHADVHATVASVTGHKCYAAEAMGTSSADYILCALIYHGRWVAQAVHNHQPPPGAVNNPHWDVPIPPPSSGLAPSVQQWTVSTENTWTTRYALWVFRRVHYPRLLMLNLPETDVMGHFTGVAQPTMRAIMRGVDANIGSIIQAYRAAGLLKRTVFVVTADHGMSRIDTRLPFEILDRAIALAGATKVYLEADTAAAIGIKEPGKARQVARNIAVLGGDLIDATYYRRMQRNSWSYRAAYSRSDLSLPLRRQLLSLANTVASNEGPDVLAFYAPHITTGDRIVRGYHWLAGHLGPQWDDQHIPLILAGAGVRHHASSSYPARLVDIAPTVERLMHVLVPAADGIPLADAMQHPLGRDRSRQHTMAQTLVPGVAALMQRSGE